MLPFFKSKEVTQYLGVDTSNEMLIRAKAKGLPMGFQLSHGDILEKSIRAKYDLIVYSWATANYILKPKDFDRHMTFCAESLATNGRVFLDMVIPFIYARNEEACTLQMREHKHLKNAVVELWDERFFNHDTHIEHRKHTFKRLVNGRVDHEFQFKTTRRFYSLSEIKEGAVRAGLEIFSSVEYGDDFVEGCYITLCKSN
jgi:hypothetical protein